MLQVWILTNPRKPGVHITLKGQLSEEIGQDTLKAILAG